MPARAAQRRRAPDRRGCEPPPAELEGAWRGYGLPAGSVRANADAARAVWDHGVGVRPVSTILDRFRRAAAVPAGVGDDLARELAPVFAALDTIEAECERVRTDAAEAAERRLVAARAKSAVVSARSREHAEAVRTETEAGRRRAREQEARSLRAEAEAEAARIKERGAAAMPELVVAVVACVRAESP